MTSERLKVLERSIRDVVTPNLQSRDFMYDRSSRTFRRTSGECSQLVNFQAGMRSLEGSFTVNLAVYHPLYSLDSILGKKSPSVREYDCVVGARLSTLRDTLLTRLFRPLIKDQSTFIKFRLTTASDKWWKFDENESKVRSELDDVLKQLNAKGFAWLERHSSVSLLKEAHSKLRPISRD